MNDFENLKDMFERAGVVYTAEEKYGHKYLHVSADGGGKGNLGYAGFVSEYDFNTEGALVSVCTYE